MSAFADLTEEERYLWAIMQDPSGIDLAEFAIYDPDAEGECFRAWPYQWVWWHCQDALMIEQCARSVGKSLSVSVSAFSFVFQHPGQEMLLTAPELVHLEPITRLVESRILNTRLTREMLPRSRSAITHRPFQIDFINGAKIVGRIPQRDGRGVKGSHPLILHTDEGQDYPEPGWIELIETVKRGFEGSRWVVHGVTRGVRDYFYKFSQPDSGWTVQRWTAMHRPNWTDQERTEKIEMYGSRDSPDYRRNIRGLHGDATNPLFVLSRLMNCVDTDDMSDYNQIEYYSVKLTDEYVREEGVPITNLVQIPTHHVGLGKEKGNCYWIGMDVGYMNHPSEILVFLESAERGKKSTMKLIARVHLTRIAHGDQVATILHMIREYQPAAFAMDKTGIGLPLFQDIQERAPDIADLIKGYGFSEKLLVDFDQTIKVDEFMDDPVKKAGIFRNVLEYSSDRLRDLVDHKRLLLPYDKEIVKEFQGQTWTMDKSGMDQFGRTRRFSQGSFHALDAAKMAVLGWAQHGIEETMKPKTEDVVDYFVVV